MTSSLMNNKLRCNVLLILFILQGTVPLTTTDNYYCQTTNNNHFVILFCFVFNHIDSVMVSLLAPSEVDRGFEPRLGQSKAKDYKLVCVASPLSTQHSGKRATTGWLGIRIIFPSGVTYLPADCCLSELALQNPTRHVGLEQSGPYHHLIEH
jgi:hypothetical protein